ncbi:uncharacterized protein LOC108098308 isoform X2 [Drosophila ficusphila]|nr:uncharacterized protein LOC108098308 isoform X2 [Drosophila ficusphila]
MIKYVELWDNVDSSFDINKHCHVDSTVEVEYMGTLPEFRQRGLANILCQNAIDSASLMSQGKISPEIFAQLPKEMQIEKPEAVVAVATAPTSKNIGHKLGFQTVHKWSFSELGSLGGMKMEPSFKESFEYAELQIFKI